MKYLSCFLLFFSFCASADDFCPERINTAQKLDGELPDAYEVLLANTANRLRSIVFYYGHPSGMAALVYDKEETTKAGAIFTWFFEEGDDIYYVCQYSYTNIEIIGRLNNKKQCVVVYDLNKKGESGFFSYKRMACAG